MILDEILENKRAEVEARKAEVPLEELKVRLKNISMRGRFTKALSSRPDSVARGPSGEIRLIAEVKKASPSKGVIRPDFDPVAIAETYEKAGASAISVLTDEKYFQGRLEYLTDIRKCVGIPLLRKDFVVDPYQIYEAKTYGADAVLLIVAALSESELSDYIALSEETGLDALVEVHTDVELDTALDTGARIIGINNRDLNTFETRLETTFRMAARVPGDRILVSESGIFTREDVLRLMEAGVNAILVGESLMRAADPGEKIRELLGIG